MYITEEMRNTYDIPTRYNILVDYATFACSEWHEWSIFNIEGLIVVAVV